VPVISYSALSARDQTQIDNAVLQIVAAQHRDGAIARERQAIAVLIGEARAAVFEAVVRERLQALVA
jgi:hypothetical protein